ncbi:hypothetical protein T11_16607 [Trichinella zimbabwensis]|uniref:Retrovirus-related Pol polyprotein from transposon TNT 1-94 n=1 Tax=Trichinella zimbabwensis TaxID=268475 RepID=A0A0V1GXD3_9BILA|nr:hypothetical protein T11_16607 [Trichinella zimbabwensis]
MLLAIAFLPVPQVRMGVCLLEAGTTVLSQNATVVDLTRGNSDYTEKQEWVAQYSVEYTSSRLSSI